MKDFRKEFKNIVHNNLDTAQDYVSLAIMKAMTAKSNESKTEIALNILETMFTKISNKIKLENGMSPYAGLKKATQFTLQPSVMEECLENEWEIEQFFRILTEIRDSLFGEEIEHAKYVYFFVRDDMTPSYQAVQLAHMAFEIGSVYTTLEVAGVNFVVCSVNKEDLYSLANDYLSFREPDMNDEITCVTTGIVSYKTKWLFSDFKLMNLPEKTNMLQNNTYEHVKVKTKNISYEGLTQAAE
jgi:hypothetical protein